MSAAWRAAAAALLAGLLLGVFAGARWERMNDRRHRRKGPDVERVLKRLERELTLTDEQRAKARGVLEARRPAFDALRAEGLRRAAVLRAETDRDLEALLDAAQKARFAELKARREERERRRAESGARR